MKTEPLLTICMSIISSEFKFFLLFAIIAAYFPARVSAISDNVVINEFIPNPTIGNDWVELYNPTSNSIDIGNWYLKDEATTHIADFSLSTSIAAGNYFAIDVGNRLSKYNDTVTLYNNANVTVDAHIYSQNPGDNVSIGRYPDGNTWANFQNPTKGGSNNNGNPIPTPTLTPTPTPTTTTAPTPTKNPTQTPTTATPTAKPTILPSSTPTPKPTIVSDNSDTENSISGNEDLPEIDLAINDAMNPSPANEPEVLGTDSTKNSKPNFPVILIIAGTLLTLAGGVLLAYYEIKNKQK